MGVHHRCPCNGIRVSVSKRKSCEMFFDISCHLPPKLLVAFWFWGQPCAAFPLSTACTRVRYYRCGLSASSPRSATSSCSQPCYAQTVCGVMMRGSVRYFDNEGRDPAELTYSPHPRARTEHPTTPGAGRHRQARGLPGRERRQAGDASPEQHNGGGFHRDKATA